MSDFGLKIGIECEKEFKKALADINQSFKVLGSEMKLVESSFDKNESSVESLAAKNQVLARQIDAQKAMRYVHTKMPRSIMPSCLC